MQGCFQPRGASKLPVPPVTYMIIMLIMFQDDVVVKVKVINYYRDFFDVRKISPVIIEVMIIVKAKLLSLF